MNVLDEKEFFEEVSKLPNLLAIIKMVERWKDQSKSDSDQGYIYTNKGTKVKL